MKTRNFFLFPTILLLVGVFFLYHCSCVPRTEEEPENGIFGGRPISFDKDSIVFDARKNKATFKTKHHEGMEIKATWSIINRDSMYIENTKIPHAAPLNQQFYYYRDTVYGDWYTVIHKDNKIHVQVNENMTDKRRILFVVIEDGNDHGSIDVIQEATKDK